MRRAKRWQHLLSAEIAVALCLWATTTASADPDRVRQSELRNLVLQDCGSCHGMTLKGGLGRPLLPEDLAHLEIAALAQIVLDGVPNTPMPPWRGLISTADAEWIARALKTGAIK